MPIGCLFFNIKMNLSTNLRWKTVLVLKLLSMTSMKLSSGRMPPPFTKVPPSVLYVVKGNTTRFVWDYDVVDKNTVFAGYSPTWLYIRNTTRVQIAYEDKWSNPKWKWSIAPSCPDSLKGRISKESTATLVISGVTTANSGTYRCDVMFINGTIKSSQVKLVVTVTPTFLPSYPNKKYHFIEGRNLLINCTAIGPPAPNITWLNITDGKVYSKTQGSGSDVLRIDNIQRHHAGVYECQAKNNPNENAATTRTTVIIYYKPIIAKDLSTKNYSSWNGRHVTLECIADGLPTPHITWYKPSGRQITTGVVTITNGSRVAITTEDRADYGSYECQAVNVAGRDEHVINVTQLFPPGAPNVTIFDEEIQASSVTVRWTKPGYDGGSPVIDYKVQINTNPPQEKNTSQTEHGFSNLTKNTKYGITVYARNIVGFGNASIITFTTKKRGAPPLPTLHLSKSTTSITLSWTKPDENGGEINNYTIYKRQGDQKSEWMPLKVIFDLSHLAYEIQLESLESGQKYWFIVTASNEFGESAIGDDRGAEVYIELKMSTTAVVPANDERKSGGDNSSDAIVIAGAVGAVVLFLIATVIAVIILRKKKIFGRGIMKRSSNERAAYHNDIDPDSVTQQAAAANLGADDGIPTYAAVDMKKKKKKEKQNDIPDYAAVDMSKKKRPGEIIYAELADFNTPGAAAEAPRPITYAGTDYADISQFQKQEEPEPTYANFPGRKSNFSNVQGM